MFRFLKFVIILVLITLCLIDSFQWYVQRFYTNNDCSDVRTLTSLILLEMSKCFQLSPTPSSSPSSPASTISICSNSSLLIKKTTNFYLSNDCSGTPIPSPGYYEQFYTIPYIIINQCLWKSVKLAMQELYPSVYRLQNMILGRLLGAYSFLYFINVDEIRIWQPTVDGGLGKTCDFNAGPQFVQVFPPPSVCGTDGTMSWKTTCDGSSLSYNKYSSVDCTGGIFESNSYLIGKGCSDYIPPVIIS